MKCSHFTCHSCPDPNYTIKQELNELQQQVLFLKEERLRLQTKLEEIENLSKYAWEQVDKNPEEAKELFKMIAFKSK